MSDPITLFWSIETGTLRLASFGLGVVITSLLCKRVNDWRIGRMIKPGERAVQSMEPLLLCVVAVLEAVLIFVTTSSAIVGHFPEWLTHPEPASMHIMYLPIILIAVIVIDRLAYHPKLKHKWCIGWILFAHVAQWGGYLLAVR